MRPGIVSRPVFSAPSFAPLRASICAVLGLTAAACGGNVTVQQSGGAGGSGGAGAAGGVGGSGGSTVTTTLKTPCAGATPIAQSNGADSGFVRCADGTIDRVQAVKCDMQVPACNGMEMSASCKSDADCQVPGAPPHGKCGHIESQGDLGGNAYTTCGCVYPCETDADCGGKSVCVCSGVLKDDNPWPSCASASCATGQDCASGECGAASYDSGCGYELGLACRTPNDPCRVDSQCPANNQCVAPYGNGAFTCQQKGCAIGRPLLVEGRARTAASAARLDWADAAIAPEVAPLPGDVRAALAAQWADVAALEHASIASFARFSLELCALGAPPDLLLRAQRAAADEVAHARIAFALASAYGGRPLGPSALDVRGVAPSLDAASIVAALVEEACVGETLGAAEARALAGFVRDPALAAAYERIAEDEGRHAELGWATLAWLLREGGEELREVAARAFERATAAARVDPALPSDVVAPEHGLLSPAMLGALRRQALDEVVTPCAGALLGTPARRSPVLA
jgi:hypothetical protein